MNEILTKAPACTALRNGVELYTLQTHRFKTARLTVALALPAEEEAAMLYSLVLGVMRRGSEAYPSLAALNRRLDELYGTTLTVRNFLHGDTHVLALTAEMLEDDFLPPSHGGTMRLLESVAEVMADMLLHPLTDEQGLLRSEAVEAEKVTQCDSIRAEANDPRTYAAMRFRRLMCEGEPHGITLGGTVEAVEATTPADVTRAWHRILSEAACTVFYVGRATADRVCEALLNSLGDWTPTPVAVPQTRLHKAPDTPRRVEEERPVGQGRLCMGWTVNTAAATLDRAAGDDAPMTVFNEIMGPMQGSLLFAYLREELGLCYECSSSFDLTKGIFSVACGIRSDRVEEAETAARYVLDGVITHGISQARVDLAVTSLLNGYRQIPDSPAAMENFWLRGVLDQWMETPARRMERISAVTAEDVTRVAASLLPDTVYFLKGTLPADEWEEDDL